MVFDCKLIGLPGIKAYSVSFDMVAMVAFGQRLRQLYFRRKIYFVSPNAII